MIERATLKLRVPTIRKHDAAHQLTECSSKRYDQFLLSLKYVSRCTSLIIVQIVDS